MSQSQELLQEITTSVEDVLRQLIGDQVSVGSPESASGGEAASTVEKEYFTVSLSVQGQTLCSIALHISVLSHLSKAMMGEAMTELDDAATDLIGESAAQCFGAVRSALGDRIMDVAEPDIRVLRDAADFTGRAAGNDSNTLKFTVSLDADTSLEAYVLVPVRNEMEHESAAEIQAAPEADEAAEDVEVKPVDFPSFTPETAGTTTPEALVDGNFDLLVDVKLEVSVELGRRKMPLADVLRLTIGNVVELDKLVGEPLEVFANGRLIAEGEVVVVDDQFGVRITRMATSKQRERTYL